MAETEWVEGWTFADQDIANRAGWGIFHAVNDPDRPFKLAAAQTERDEEIWLKVYDLAVAGDTLCRKALDVIMRVSRREFELMRRYLSIYRKGDSAL